jgi:ABC-2 type transport system ATP-binding protein
MEQRRARWLEVDARDREGARTTLAEAGIAVDGCGGDVNARNGTAGALHLSDVSAIAHPEEVARRLVAAGVAVTRLSVEEEDLETQFLRLVGATPGGVEHAR